MDWYETPAAEAMATVTMPSFDAATVAIARSAAQSSFTPFQAISWFNREEPAAISAGYPARIAARTVGLGGQVP
jgi:hypothetical protein